LHACQHTYVTHSLDLSLTKETTECAVIKYKIYNNKYCKYFVHSAVTLNQYHCVQLIKTSLVLCKQHSNATPNSLYRTDNKPFLNISNLSTEYKKCVFKYISSLTLNLLTTTIVAPPSNASKWQIGLNSVFKGLMALKIESFHSQDLSVYCTGELSKTMMPVLQT
jgi:hypothetical protein